jgi:hypothetical protein
MTQAHYLVIPYSCDTSNYAACVGSHHESKIAKLANNRKGTWRKGGQATNDLDRENNPPQLVHRYDLHG